MLFHQPNNSKGNSYNAFTYQNVAWQPHFHKNFELIHVISGAVDCTVGERHATVTAGEFALILSNEVHALSSRGESLCWIGVFSGDFVHAFEKKVRGLAGNGFVFRCEQSIGELLKTHLLTDRKPPDHLLKACLYAAVAEYERQIPLFARRDKSEQLMCAITDYISENYKEKIGLAQMATALGYNYHYLSKCCHRIFDMSFTDLLNSHRLDMALALLIDTDMDITEVALESGFQSVRSFNEFFRTRIGTTPAKYRRGAV